MDEDRAAFEQWAKSNGHDIRRVDDNAELWPGVYLKNHVDHMWQAWRQALSNERARHAAEMQ